MRKIVFLFFITTMAFSIQPPDIGFIERKLTENRYFFYFINIGVSNFGGDMEKQKLKNAAISDVKAHQEFLKGDTNKSFKMILESHKKLMDLYRIVLEKYYRKDARILLDKSAPIVVGKKDRRAEHFLRLGYRDITDAYRFQRLGESTNKYLYSKKIKIFIDGIKIARRAKRYALLALIESNTPINDKSDFQFYMSDDAVNKENAARIPDFQRVKSLLINMINDKRLDNFYNFFLHHDDNFTFINKDDYLRIFYENLKVE